MENLVAMMCPSNYQGSNMKKTLLALIATSAAIAGAQTVQQPTFSTSTLAQISTIQRTALDSTYAFERTEFLTNNIGPRLSGSAQAERAVEYVAEEMKKLGLEVRLQKLMVPHWVRGEERGELVEFFGMAKGTTQKVVLTALGGSVATGPEGLIGDIVVVGSYEELEKLGRKGVEGKIVLFNTKFDRALSSAGFGSQAYSQAVQFRSGGPIAAAKLGAMAALVRSAGGSQNRLAHTGGTRYQEGAPKIPAAAVTFEDAETIAKLVKWGKVRIKLTLTPQILPDAPSYNVIADLKGTEHPEQIVIVSGHLDSWDLGTGALDDACGVGVAMQVPYLIKSLGLKPKRTIRVIAYMNEENGGVGGDVYAREYQDQIPNHIAAIEADLGASHPVGFLFAGKQDALAMLTPLSKILLSQGAGLTEIRENVAADIGPLRRRGVPSIAPWFDTRTYFNYHHTAADTFDKIVPRELAENGALVAVLAYGIAQAEQSLPR